MPFWLPLSGCFLPSEPWRIVIGLAGSSDLRTRGGCTRGEPPDARADRRARRGRGTQIIHSGADHVAGFRTQVAVMWALLSTFGGARLSARSTVRAGLLLVQRAR